LGSGARYSVIPPPLPSLLPPRGVTASMILSTRAARVRANLVLDEMSAGEEEEEGVREGEEEVLEEEEEEPERRMRKSVGRGRRPSRSRLPRRRGLPEISRLHHRTFSTTTWRTATARQTTAPCWTSPFACETPTASRMSRRTARCGGTTHSSSCYCCYVAPPRHLASHAVLAHVYLQSPLCASRSPEGASWRPPISKRRSTTCSPRGNPP